MITFLHLATKHNRMWLLVLGARMIQRENIETLQAERQHTGKAGREGFSHTHHGGVSVLALLLENWTCRDAARTLGIAGGVFMGVWAQPWGGW